jgi:hypothetical protein
MVGKDIYTNCGTVGLTEWHDGATRVACDTQCPDGCPTEGARVLDREREWPDGGCEGCLIEGGVSGGGPTAGLGGGPMGDYISAVGPHFWALSSSAQSYLQEMRERRVLMSESGIL